MWHATTTFSTGGHPTQGGLANAWQMWDYKSHNRSIAYMTGTGAVFALTQMWQTRMALAGIRTHTIDCAIRFNTYSIADESLRLANPPETISSEITVTRAFTPYQILDAVSELKKNEVVFVLAPAKQFFDGDVAFDEGLFLIQKLVRFFSDAHERGVALFVVERPSYAAPAFSTFLSDMRPLTQKSKWELTRLDKDNTYRLRHVVHGVLAHEFVNRPNKKIIAAPRLIPMPPPAPRNSQMQFSF